MAPSDFLPTVNFGGLASGLDTNSIVSQLMAIERRPQQRIQQQSALEQQRQTDLEAIQAQLQSLAAAAAALSNPSTWTTSATIASSDAARVSATGSGVPPGGFKIDVSQLARAAQLTQSTSAQAASGDDTLQIAVGAGTPFTVQVASGDSLDKIASNINAAASGKVYASVVNSKLVLSGQTTGLANTISVTSAVGGPVPADLGLTQTVAPQDASYTLDGAAKTSSTNALTNVATGLTVTLLGVTSSTVSVTVGAAGPNTPAVQSAVQAFVSAYNATIDLVSSNVTEARVASPKTAGDRLKGDLNGDPTLLALLSRLRASVGDVVSGAAAGMNVLSEAGLSTGAAVGGGPLDRNAIRGDLTLDSSTLTDALTSRFDDVKRLFTSATGSYASEGLAQRIQAVTAAYAGATGSITTALAGEANLISSLGKQSSDWDVRLTGKEQALRRQFADMETALSRFQTEGSWLTGQISSLGRG